MAAVIKKCNILVKNIPWTIGNYELEKYFSQYGRVKNAYIIFDRKTGFSKSYGFVEYFNHNVVDKLLEEPQEHKLDGCVIRIMMMVE